MPGSLSSPPEDTCSTTLQDGSHYYPLFTEEGTEVWSGKVAVLGVTVTSPGLASR